MKLPKIEIGNVQSLGRANLGAVSQIANKTAATAGVEGRLLNEVSKVALEFKKREDDAEYNSALTSAQLEMNDFKQKYEAKEFYTTEEVEGLPDGAVRRTHTGTDDNGLPVEIPRNDIPAYQVYPYMLKNKLQGLLEQKSQGISNPFMREDFINKSSAIASQQFLQASLKAEKQQQVYLKSVATDESLQFAINGNLKAAEFTIQEADFNPQEKEELLRNRREVYEWGTDSDVLRTGSLKKISERLNYLEGDYGKSKKDYLGADKAAGSFNLESNIRRFKSALTTLKGKHSNEARLEYEELIRARGNGNKVMETSFANGSFAKRLRNDPRLTENERNLLQKKAEDADYEGGALTMTRLTSASEDAAAQARFDSAMENIDPRLNDENTAAQKSHFEAVKAKLKALRSDATTYLILNNDLLRTMAEELQKPEVQDNPELRVQRTREFFIASRAEQERMGLQNEDVNFMTAPQVEAFKKESEAVGRDANAPFKLMLQMKQLQQESLNEWPAFYSQLIREGAIKPEHVMASIIKDPALQSQYIEALNNKETMEVTQLYKDNIKDVRTVVTNSMLNLRKTLITPGSMPNVAQGLPMNSQVSAFEEGITQIAMMQINTSGKFDQGALETMVEKVINDNWVLVDNVRIPRVRYYLENGQEKSQKYDTEKIENALSKMRTRSSYKISKDLKFSALTVGGISPEDDQAILSENFKKFAVPSTNSNETGIIFKWSSGNPVMVMRNGRSVPLTVKFEALESYGRIIYRSQQEMLDNKLVIE